MKHNNSPALRRYYRQVAAALPCDRRLKQLILADIREKVQDYLDEHPGADMQQLLAHTGTPEQLAMGYLADLSSPDVLRKLHTGKRLTTMVAATLLAMLLLWGIGVTMAVNETKADFSGYSEYEIVEQG